MTTINAVEMIDAYLRMAKVQDLQDRIDVLIQQRDAAVSDLGDLQEAIEEARERLEGPARSAVEDAERILGDAVRYTYNEFPASSDLIADEIDVLMTELLGE